MRNYQAETVRDIVPAPALGEHVEPQRGDGPVPVVDDVAAMLMRLALEHRRILNGGSCCIVLCAADDVPEVSPDRVLTEAADRFAAVLRGHDAIFRYGEDKLLLCLPHIKSSDGSRLMARLRRLVCDRPVSLPEGGRASISVTLGGAMMNLIDMVEETAACAERSLKSGRGAGGNCVCMWAPEVG